MNLVPEQIEALKVSKTALDKLDFTKFTPDEKEKYQKIKDATNEILKNAVEVKEIGTVQDLINVLQAHKEWANLPIRIAHGSLRSIINSGDIKSENNIINIYV